MVVNVGPKKASDCTWIAKQPPSSLRRRVQGLSETCICRGIVYGVKLIKDRWSAWRSQDDSKDIQRIVQDSLMVSTGGEDISVVRTISLDFKDPDQMKNTLREVFIVGDEEACKQLAMVPWETQEPAFFYELFELGIKHRFKIGLEALEKQWHASYMELPLRGEGSVMHLLTSAIMSNYEEPINILKKHPCFLDLNRKDMCAVMSLAINEGLPMGILALSGHPTAKQLIHDDFLEIVTRLQEDDLACCNALAALPGWMEMSSDQLKILAEECINNRWVNLFEMTSRHPCWKTMSVEGLVEITKVAIQSSEWKPLLQRIEFHPAWRKIEQEQLAQLAELAICGAYNNDAGIDESDEVILIASESSLSMNAYSIINRLKLHSEWNHLSEENITRLLLSKKDPEFGWIYTIFSQHPSWHKLNIEQLLQVSKHVVSQEYSEVIVMQLMQHPCWNEMSERQLQEVLSQTLLRHQDGELVFKELIKHPQWMNFSGDSIRRLLWDARDPKFGWVFKEINKHPNFKDLPLDPTPDGIPGMFQIYQASGGWNLPPEEWVDQFNEIPIV